MAKRPRRRSAIAMKARSIALLLVAQVAGMSLWFITAAVMPDLIAETALSPFRQAALSSGVQSYSPLASLSAPCSNRYCTTGRWPCHAAKCSGVLSHQFLPPCQPPARIDTAPQGGGPPELPSAVVFCHVHPSALCPPPAHVDTAPQRGGQ